MRDIKYRAYRKDTKSMHPVDELVWDENHNLRWVKIGDHLLDIKIIELMQSTGLKDKNGKEIWESDLIKNSWDGKVVEVKLRTGCFGFHDNDEWEVIGNIYESKPISDIITTDG